MQQSYYIEQKLNKSFCYIISNSREIELVPSRLDYFGEMNEGVLSLKIHQRYKNSIINLEDCKAVLVLPQTFTQSVSGINCILNGKNIQLKVEECKRAEEIANLAEMTGRMTIRSESSIDNQILKIFLGLLPYNSECDITIQMEIISDNNNSNVYQTIIPFSEQNIDSTNFNFSIQFNETAKIESINIFDSINKKYSDYSFDGKILKLTKKPLSSIMISTELKSQIPNVIINDLQDEYSIIQLFPKFSNKSINSDFIFILDCSGSMSGSPIKNAIECLTVFMHSLPIGCNFNIIKFGSKYDCIFNENRLVEYNDANLKKADYEIMNTIANYGGTNLYGPLLSAYYQSQISRKKGRIVQIFLLTDGMISDKENVFKLARKNRSNNRIFSLGIGNSVDKDLVSGLASLSFGKFDFIDSSLLITDKVINLLSSSLAPSLTDVSLHSSNDELLEIIPNPMIPIFDEKMTMIYVKRKDKSKPIKNVLITGNIESEQIELVIDNSVNISNSSCKKLFAFNAISDYQNIYEDAQLSQNELDKIKDKIIKLSIENKILSKFTSFVGFEKNPHLKPNQRKMQQDDPFLGFPTHPHNATQSSGVNNPFCMPTSTTKDLDPFINSSIDYNQICGNSYSQQYSSYSPFGSSLNQCQLQQQQFQMQCPIQNNFCSSCDYFGSPPPPQQQQSFSNQCFNSTNIDDPFSFSQQQQQSFSNQCFNSTNIGDPFSFLQQQQQQSFSNQCFNSTNIGDPFSFPQQQQFCSNQCYSSENVDPFSFSQPHQQISSNDCFNSTSIDDPFSSQNNQQHYDYDKDDSNIIGNSIDCFSGNSKNDAITLNDLDPFSSSFSQKQRIIPPKSSFFSLIDVISSQDFDGKWESSFFDSLLHFLFNGKTNDCMIELTHFFSSLKISDEETKSNMKSTIVALLILMKFFGKEHSKWKLIEMKAINWLNSKLQMKWETEIPILLSKV